MNNNVASFDSFETDQQIAAHQTGLARIILEGDTDVTLFRRFWFPQLQDTFQFIEAGKVAIGAGCTGVISAVEHSQREGIPAVGIVDRDTLFRNKDWSRLFSLDSTVMNSDWKATSVYVTSRWEVEAYLLEPDLLADWVAVAHRAPPAPLAYCEQALNKTLAACEVLLRAADYFAAQHESGIPISHALFCDQPLERVIEVCSERIAAAAPNQQAVAAQVRSLIVAIHENSPTNQADQLRFLLRYVDTKRLLARLIHTLCMREGAHWTLAGFMLKGQRRPSELERLLVSIEEELIT